MGAKIRGKFGQSYSDPYEDYEDELSDDMDDDLDDDFNDLSKDFFSTEWENPSGSGKKLSSRRIIERRNELKELFSQFDDWEEIELGNDW